MDQIAARCCHALTRALLFAATLASAAHAQRPQFDVVEASVADIQSALAGGRVTSVQLVDAYLARIAAYDRGGPRINALVHVNARARAEAAALDAERARGAVRGPLHGIPILLKDNFNTSDMPTTGSSLALAGHVPPADAFQTAKLRAAGAIIIGKTNLHELAAGILTVSSLGGQTRNPYDPWRNPGGSSGGTGAAVASSFAALGWGSDTCGSIRIPAAHNALFGLRPTKGLSSISGIIPLSHSQDVAGPLARTVADLAAGLDATIGIDDADSATHAMRGRDIRFGDALRADALRGARLGVLTAYFGSDSDDREVGDIVRDALTRMKEAGAEIIEIDIPDLTQLIANTSTIDSEFRFDLQSYLAGVPDAPVRSLGEILERGLYHEALEATFRRRNAAAPHDTTIARIHVRRAALHDAVVRYMDAQRLTAIVYPTVRRKPAPIGEAQRGANCQLSASTGMPSLSAPAGFTADSLPVGMELMGRRFDDARLLSLAFAWEQLAKPRRAPRTTPRLLVSRAPEPIAFPVTVTSERGATAHAVLAWDPARSALAYDVTVSAIPPELLHAVVLRRNGTRGSSAIVHHLAGPRQIRVAGELTLSPAQQRELEDGVLELALHTAGSAPARKPVHLPGRTP